MSQLIESYEGDSEIERVITELLTSKWGPNEFELSKGLLKFKGKWVIDLTADLRRQVFVELHEKGVGGHSGARATLKRIEQYFHWVGMKKDITTWVAECPICQVSKHETLPSPGLLQPLPIPKEIWRNIAMDFITGLPNPRRFEVIWVITDRFSRYSRLFPLIHPISAKSLSTLFFENVFKLHGMPSSIVNDRDPIFTSEFWKTLFKLVGTRLHLSTSYHTQSDGSRERESEPMPRTIFKVHVWTSPKAVEFLVTLSRMVV